MGAGLLRNNGRGACDLRKISLTLDVNRWAEGSCLVEWGETKVLCTASVDNKVPPFLRGSGQGWVTAEYAMLPRATSSRTVRESVKGRQSGRSMEISRLIGRSLRASVDLAQLGELTVTLDCDVLQADGGTRTASITGAFLALAGAVRSLIAGERIAASPFRMPVAAVSIGKVDGQILTDLDYSEDSRAEVDFNVVGNGNGVFIELQGTGEGGTFSRSELNELLDCGENALAQITELQRKTMGVKDWGTFE